jgi:hypothetical protein
MTVRQRLTRSTEANRRSPGSTLWNSSMESLNSVERVDYQSEYLVPSSAVPVDLEYTSNTLLPAEPVESGSSCTARIPQSALPVIGSTGIRRKRRIFSVPVPPYETPSTSVCKSGGYPSLPTCTCTRSWSARSLYLSIAPRISRKLCRNSLSLARTTVKRKIGRAAEAKIRSKLDAIISSSNVRPASRAAIRLRAPNGSLLRCLWKGNSLFQVSCIRLASGFYDDHISTTGTEL